MKVLSPLKAFFIFVALPTISSELTNEHLTPAPSEAQAEELPKPEALRGGAPSYLNSRPSYNAREAYEVLRRGSADRYDSNNHFIEDEFDDDEFVDDRLEEKLRDLMRKRMGDPYQRSSLREENDIDGASSAIHNDIDRSGYGLTCTTGYINASAVALLAFLFLLNIVQDVITQITTGRKKRSSDESPLQQFIADGGVDVLYENIPDLLLPLMVELSDTSHPRCILQPLCALNKELSDSYGEAGRVIASLTSNIIAKAFTGTSAHWFNMALTAAALGREGSCVSVPVCANTGRGNNL